MDDAFTLQECQYYQDLFITSLRKRFGKFTGLIYSYNDIPFLPVTSWLKSNFIFNMKLSICIPTYNRAAYIGETLDSIVLQLNSDVEIIILDGASTDNTESVVVQYQKRFNNIRYIKAAVNSGVDADLSASINEAKGEYCWLMSSDDLLTSSAISLVLDGLKSECNIYLANRTECTKEMTPVRRQYWFPKSTGDKIFDITDDDAIKNYLDSTDMIGALFSYIPCIIVRRKDWLEAKGSEQFFGSGYAHVFRFFSIFKRGCRMMYISSPLVLCRMDNDSFSSNGLVSRYMLDFNGYLNIANELFIDKCLRKKFLHVLIREHKWYRIVKLSSHIKDKFQWVEIRDKLLTIGYSRSTLFTCRLLGNFKKIILLLVFIRKNIYRS
jgi:abequosyltransferase